MVLHRGIALVSRILSYSTNLLFTQPTIMPIQSQHTYFIAEWIAFSVAVFSFLCSIMTLLIIMKMKKKSAYLKLITLMTVYQLLYDVNYMLGPVETYATCVLWNFLDVLGGLGSTFTSNVISYTMIFVVYRIRSFDIAANFVYIFLFAGVIPILFAILTFAVIVPQSNDDDIPYQQCIYDDSTLAIVIGDVYYWGRVISIVYNFITFSYISLRVQRITVVMATNRKRPSVVDNPNATTTRSTKHTATRNTQHAAPDIHQYITSYQVEAIYVLASRLKYYPLVQSLCRVGSAWNEFLGYRYASDASLYTSSITAPLSGFCYFIIFLIMQPHARRIFYEYITCQSSPQHTISTASLQRHNLRLVGYSGETVGDPTRITGLTGLSERTGTGGAGTGTGTGTGTTIGGRGSRRHYLLREDMSEHDLEAIIDEIENDAWSLPMTNNPLQLEEEGDDTLSQVQSVTGSIARSYHRGKGGERDDPQENDEDNTSTSDYHLMSDTLRQQQQDQVNALERQSRASSSTIQSDTQSILSSSEQKNKNTFPSW